MSWFTNKGKLPDAADALPGREAAMALPGVHLVLGSRIQPPFPQNCQTAVLGMGCFWGAERLFWQLPGVYTTAVGYSGGFTPNPTYQEVCSGRTGHAEVVLVVFDPSQLSYPTLLRTFWEGHDPTQGMRQGADSGTQYRSALYSQSAEQLDQAQSSREAFQQALRKAGQGEITTEIEAAGPFYYAEQYHQQYLEANPGGYCGLAGTGVSCPTGILAPS